MAHELLVRCRCGVPIAHIFLAVILVLTPSLMPFAADAGRESPPPAVHNMTLQEMQERVFEKEHYNVMLLKHIPLIEETYLQSMAREQRRGMDIAFGDSSEGVIDDAYFMGKVYLERIERQAPIEDLLAGKAYSRHWIKVNNDVSTAVNPNIFLQMFLVGLWEFNDSAYKLSYVRTEWLAGAACLRFSVSPLPSEEVRFSGDLWVTPDFNIVRMKGGYDRIHCKRCKRLTFELWRQGRESSDFLPIVVHFDEKHTFPYDNNLDYHLRGISVLWRVSAPQNQRSTKNQPLISGSRVTPGLEQTSRVVQALQEHGFLASPGSEEPRLDRIVEVIDPSAAHNREIHCRLLLTTPAEIFASGDTIILSRGLLNLVPDKSVLAVLLAQQIAHIVLGHGDLPFRDLLRTLSGETPIRSTRALRQRAAAENTAANREAMILLKGSVYENGLAEAQHFLSMLHKGEKRFPNLLQARFGTGNIPENIDFVSGEPEIRSGSSSSVVLTDSCLIAENNSVSCAGAGQ